MKSMKYAGKLYQGHTGPEDQKAGDAAAVAAAAVAGEDVQGPRF